MRSIKYLLLALLFASLTIPAWLLPGRSSAEEEPIAKEQPAKANDSQKATLIQLYSWATILPKELIDLQTKFSADTSLKTVETVLPNLSDEINQLRSETTTAQATSDLPRIQVSGLQTKVYRITIRLTKLNESVSDKITRLSAERSNWLAKKEQIAGLKNKEELSLTLALEQQQDLIDTVDKAIQLIDENLKVSLMHGKKIGDLQILLYSIDSDLQALDNELKTTSIQQTSPSILSADFYSRIKLNLLKQSLDSTKQFAVDQLTSLKDNFPTFLLCLIAFLLVCFIFHKTKLLTAPSSHYYPFATCPLATTVFIGASINIYITMLPVSINLPERWEALLNILALLAVIRLIRHLMPDNWQRQQLIRLTMLMAIFLFLVLLNIPKMLMLLFVFYFSLVALGYYFFQLPALRGQQGVLLWIRKMWGIFPAVVLFLIISGYEQFAGMTFLTVISSIVACLIVWMIYMLHFGIIELILSVLPVSFIRENVSIILNNLKPVLVWLHILLLAAVESVIWDYYSTVNDAFGKILNLGFDLAGVHISPGFIFTIVLVTYGVLVTSRAIQSLLLTKILPRYGAERGVQLSIARLAHYALMSIGILLLLNVIGFQMSQLTLLGGALGVGIGFGLQAIVNNFVSGLILLFERPIKVGDTIQIGSELGEVKELGLRATIIQTFDNAEIVIPNSDLITGQVTNWTLASRKVRVKVPVGVAYGTDIAKVLEILKECAKANPMVLNTPTPSAFFLAFGASSLDFELRVWIPEFLDKIQVLSDLNQDIENEFALNKIEIPFPQTDLHLRSVDEAAATRLRQPSSGLAPKTTQSPEPPDEV